MARVVVLGAGPAGLGAAYRAAAAGHEVDVLERADHVGGLSASFEVAGVRVDHGSHRLHPATPPGLLGVLQDLLGEDLQVRRRHGRIRLEGRWIAFPLQPVDLLRRLPPQFALAAARDALVSPLRHPGRDTFAEILLAGLGPALCHRFYFPYARKLWGLEPEEIDGEQARRRVGGRAAGTLLRKVAGRGSGDGLFYYPRRGFGQTWEALASAACAQGARLHLGSEVTSIRTGEEELSVQAGEEVYRAGHVWSTAPLSVLARLADPAPPTAVMRAASRLRARAMTLVYLVVDSPRYTEFDAHYVPDSQTPVSRLSEPKNYRDGDDPDDRTVLCAEIPCAVGDDIWRAEPDALGKLVAGALERMELPEPAITAVEVRRVRAAYPIYDVGYSEALAVLQAWAGSHPGLLTFGRHGLFVHNNSHHALEMGWEAAGSLTPDGVFDRSSWEAASAGFGSHVVED